jgi:hypothetical protein
MFTGHYGPSFAFAAAEKRLPLWLLFIAVQFVDILWAIFVMLGIEKVRIVPGITASSPLDLYYMPYTHSLVGALGWSLLAFVVCQMVPRLRGVRTGLILAAAVFSHWILDLLVHRPDLSLYGGAYKMGFGLWNYRIAAFVVEMVVLFGFAAPYVKIARHKERVLVFLAALALLQAVGTFIFPPPSSDRAEAITALFFYFLLAAIAAWVDRGQPTSKISAATPAKAGL